jgi:hypothetical protein
MRRRFHALHATEIREVSQQLQLLPLRETPDHFDHVQMSAMHEALLAIAGSTLLEFPDALRWAQWCRMLAANAVGEPRTDGIPPRGAA